MTRPAPRIDPEELLANAAWVRALARSLVGDASLADDVAQQTMVAAIERPPRAGVPLAAWMARVARNLSFNARRAERRRALHEAATPSRAASPSPEESVARTEMFRVVVAAVLALEPIYRDVVVLRFFDDLDMTEVARRLAVPSETARTRLKRALATLRERLDAEYGDRRAWALALVGPGAMSRRATTTAATVAGGALLAKMIASAAVALALLVGGWFVAAAHGRRADDAGAVETAAANPSAVARPASPRGRAVAASETAPSRPVAAAPDTTATPSRWLLRGRLDHFDERETTPAKVAAYFWHEDMDGSKAPEPIRVDAASDGRFEVDFTASIATARGKRALVVVVDHPAYLLGRAEVSVPPQVDADAAGAAIFDCVVELHRADILDVRVVDGDGNALPGAHVGAFPVHEKMPSATAVDSAVADASGTARVRLPAGERALIVGSSDGLVPASVERGFSDGASVELTLRRGADLAGRVLRNGSPVCGAELHGWASVWDVRTLRAEAIDVFWLPDVGVAPSKFHATTDTDGRWRVAGLSAGGWHVGVDRLPDAEHVAGFDREAEAPANGVDFDVVAGRLQIDVRDAAGPVSGVRVVVSMGSSGAVTTTNAEGFAEATTAAGQKYSIETWRDGYRNSRVEGTSPAAGESATARLTIERLAKHGPIVIVVNDPDGRPIEPAGFAFFTKDAPPWNAMERFGDGQRGNYLFNDVEAGKYRLVVRPGRHWQPDWTWDGDAGTWLDETLDVEVPTTDAVQYEVTARRGGRLRIAARDASGKIVPATCVLRDASGAAVKHYVATRYGAGGAHSMGEESLGGESPSDVAEALPPGKYRVTLSMDGFDEKTVDAEIVAGKTCVLDVTLDGTAGPRPREAAAPAQPK